jgi:hypothetical protein
VTHMHAQRKPIATLWMPDEVLAWDPLVSATRSREVRRIAGTPGEESERPELAAYVLPARLSPGAATVRALPKAPAPPPAAAAGRLPTGRNGACPQRDISVVDLTSIPPPPSKKALDKLEKFCQLFVHTVHAPEEGAALTKSGDIFQLDSCTQTRRA